MWSCMTSIFSNPFMTYFSNIFIINNSTDLLMFFQWDVGRVLLMHQYFAIYWIQVAVDLLLLLYIVFITFILAFIFFSPFNNYTRYSNIALFSTYSFAKNLLKFSFRSLFKLKTISSDGQTNTEASSLSDEISWGLSCINSSC